MFAPLDPLPILLYVPVLFQPIIEGRIAIVTDAGWNAVDAKMPFDERHARVRRNRVVLAPQSSGVKFSRDSKGRAGMTVANERVHRGDHV